MVVCTIGEVNAVYLILGQSKRFLSFPLNSVQLGYTVYMVKASQACWSPCGKLACGKLCLQGTARRSPLAGCVQSVVAKWVLGDYLQPQIKLLCVTPITQPYACRYIYELNASHITAESVCLCHNPIHWIAFHLLHHNLDPFSPSLKSTGSLLSVTKLCVPWACNRKCPWSVGLSDKFPNSGTIMKLRQFFRREHVRLSTKLRPQVSSQSARTQQPLWVSLCTSVCCSPK